jgi:hypothetical protein
MPSYVTLTSYGNMIRIWDHTKAHDINRPIEFVSD